MKLSASAICQVMLPSAHGSISYATLAVISPLLMHLHHLLHLPCLQQAQLAE